jgi:hypothetical protein
MPKPVCVKCSLFFKPKKNGVTWEEGAPHRTERGGEEWGPYKLWEGDLWECRGCGVEIVVGHGSQPLSIAHEEDYYRKRESFGVLLRVDDC